MIYQVNLHFIDKLTNIVDEHLSDPNFSIVDLTRQVGISHSSLHRKLKSITGQSISQFIRGIRLKRAMEYLKNQDVTVAEAAFKVGFGSPTYFTKCFHEYFGFPPAKLKRQYSSAHKLFDIKSDLNIPLNPYRSVAVLPFENNTEDDSFDFLVNGLHEDIISELGYLKSIRVISKTSVVSLSTSDLVKNDFSYKEDIDFFIKATVQIVDDKIRIRLRFYKMFLEDQLWEQTFDAPLSRILMLYGQIVKTVANKIEMGLNPGLQDQLEDRREVNPECYKEYLRGRNCLYQFTEEGMKKGVEHFLEAVRKDPTEPFAYAGLATGYIEIAHGPFKQSDAYEKAEWAANQALKIDPSLAEAHLALAEIYMYSKWNYNESEKHFLQALGSNPNLSLAHYHYAWLLYLLGRNDDAVREHRLAQRYDPFNPIIVSLTGLILAYEGRFEEALSEIEKSLEIQKNCPFSYFAQEETFILMGKVNEALVACKKLADIDPGWSWLLGYSYAIANQREEAESILNKYLHADINSWSAMGIAVMYGALGHKDEAYKWIKYEPHHAWIPWMGSVNTMAKYFRADLRFNDLLNYWNLPEK